MGTVFAGGDEYERLMGRWSRKLAPMLVEFAQVAEGNVILDVGCGTGALTLTAAAITAVRATGVDPSPTYIERAQRDASDRVTFEVGDAQALRFPDDTFDRTLSQLVLNFVADQAAALREMIRVTRPGGVVAAAVWDYGDGMEMLRAFWDEAVVLDPTAPDEASMPLSRRGELPELWRANGLHNIEDRPLIVEMPFVSFDDYWHPFLGGQGPSGTYTLSLPEPGRQALRSRLRERFVGEGPDMGFTLRARAWAVRGVVT